MEYDRALYRVYERVMEDINNSPSPRSANDDGSSSLVSSPAEHYPYCSSSRSSCATSARRWWDRATARRYVRVAHDREPVVAARRSTANPLHALHARRARARLGEQRRTRRANDDREVGVFSNGSVSTEEDEEENDDDADENEGFVSSSFSSDEDADLEARPRQRRRRRRDERNAREDEPLERTLDRIRNGSTLTNNDVDDGESCGCTKSNLYRTQRVFGFLGAFHLIVLAVLHLAYVTPYQRRRASDPSVVRTCLEYALATRPHEQRSDWSDRNVDNTTTLRERPLLGADEILQIKIVYDERRCAMERTNNEERRRCSRVRYVDYTNHTDTENVTTTTVTTTPPPETDAIHKDDNNTASKQIGFLDSPGFWETPHYRYSSTEVLTILPTLFNLRQNVSVVNVTLTQRCLSTGRDKGDNNGDDNDDYSSTMAFRVRSLLAPVAETLAQMYGTDSVIINQLMYGIKTEDAKEEELHYVNGLVENVRTTERWNWTRRLLESSADAVLFRRPFYWLLHKTSVLLQSVLALFLVTSITALVVRVLTGSGVVLMFPLFSLLRSAGVAGADDRVLGLSYPWIGRARAAARRRGLFPDSHLVAAHAAKVVLYYGAYEACQEFWSASLYRRSVPEALPVWIFGACMVWEYFMVVFVRSALGAHFFPRASALLLVGYHAYLFSVPYGWFDAALIPLFCLTAQAGVHTILVLEAPAAARGAVSAECPREVYNRLSWSEWTAGLPSEWTIFLPLNSRYTPLHDRDVTGEEGAGTATTMVGRAGEEEEESSSSSSSEDYSMHEDTSDLEDSDVSVQEVEMGEMTSRTSNERSGLHARRVGNHHPSGDVV